jgi:hypothetical protein
MSSTFNVSSTHIAIGCSSKPQSGQVSLLWLNLSRLGDFHVCPQSHANPRQPRKTVVCSFMGLSFVAQRAVRQLNVWVPVVD